VYCQVIGVVCQIGGGLTGQAAVEVRKGVWVVEYYLVIEFYYAFIPRLPLWI